jgi:hypothetical protein
LTLKSLHTTKNIKHSGVPYITIHAQRKSRAIWRLINSIDLHENLFLDIAAAAENNNDGENDGERAESGGGLDGKEKGVRRSAKEDDDDIVDSDDEMDDEGEEFDVNLTGGDGGEGRNGNTSLVCIFAFVEREFH